MNWQKETREERPCSFYGKGTWVMVSIVLMVLQYVVAVLLFAASLVPAGVTLTVIATVCGPLFLWYCWKY